jgi:hypothetical protein
MKLKELPISIGSKLVGSQVRDWGERSIPVRTSTLRENIKLMINDDFYALIFII